MKKSMVVAADRRCLFSKWDCLEFLEVVKSLQNYDVLGEAGNFAWCAIFWWQA